MFASLSRRRTSHTIAAIAGVAFALGFTGSAAPVHAQQNLGVTPSQHFKEGNLDILQVRAPNVYVIIGAGGNIVVHVGWMGVVLVDAGSTGMSNQVLAAIQRIAPDRKIRFIIDTGADPDHVGGNEALAQAGRTLLNYVPGTGAVGGQQGGDFQTNNGAAGVMAHENVLLRMSTPKAGTRESPYPAFGWPTEAFTGARTRSIYLNDDGVSMTYQPAAHDNADVFVSFRRTDVIAAGDIIDLRHFPVIDTDHGGTISGEIAALTRLIDMSIPPAPLTWHEARTLIVPGHGRLMDQGDVVEYRDMLIIIRDTVQDLARKGLNIDQIKARNPTEGYNQQYGSDAALRDAFVTAVFKTMNTKP
jgi:glyoxylase-like metal-dependent hydrolase (beta-lactamase superfamily II)